MNAKPSNFATIENATGIAWDDWMRYFTEQQASGQAHYEIANLAHARIPDQVANSGWWAQSVAVAFEQAIGRRLPGQAGDGTFQFSVSRTLSMDLDATLATWQEVAAQHTQFNGVRAQGEPRTSSSAKWRYWRIGLADGTRCSVNMGSKGDRTLVAVNHTKIPVPDAVQPWQVFWRQLLADMG